MGLWQEVLQTRSTTMHKHAEGSAVSGTLRKNKYAINIPHCLCHWFRQLSAFSSAAAVSEYMKGPSFRGLDEVLFISWWCWWEGFAQLGAQGGVDAAWHSPQVAGKMPEVYKTGVTGAEQQQVHIKSAAWLLFVTVKSTSICNQYRRTTPPVLKSVRWLKKSLNF